MSAKASKVSKISKLTGIHAVLVAGYPHWLEPVKHTILTIEECGPLDAPSISFGTADGNAVTVRRDQLLSVVFDPAVHARPGENPGPDHGEESEESGTQDTQDAHQEPNPLADYLESLPPEMRVMFFHRTRSPEPH